MKMAAVFQVHKLKSSTHGQGMVIFGAKVQSEYNK